MFLPVDDYYCSCRVEESGELWDGISYPFLIKILSQNYVEFLISESSKIKHLDKLLPKAT